MTVPPLGSRPDSSSPRKRREAVFWIGLSLPLWGFIAFTRSRFSPRSWDAFADPELLVHALVLQTALCAAAWTALRRHERGVLAGFMALLGALASRSRGQVIRDFATEILPFAPGILVVLASVPGRALLDRTRAAGARVRVPLVAGFLLVCGWFRWAEVRSEHFFDLGGGPLYLANNFFRLLAVAYVLWLHCALGFLVRKVFERPEPAGARPEGLLERFVLAFFAGAAVIQTTLFALGLLGLFHRWLVCGAAALALALAPTEPLEAARSRLVAALPRRLGSTRAARLLVGTAAATLLLVCKGLYPHCTVDIATHYFPYYEAVVEHHGIGPNEVWYHYYHTKGSGAIFLGILFTDTLGAQLTSCAYFAVSALVVHALVRGATRQRGWAFLAATTYVAAMALGAGEFEMQHVITMGYASGLVFMAKLLDAHPERRNVVAPLAGALAVAWVLHVPTVAALVAAVLFLLAIPAAARKDWSLVRSYLVVLASASVAFAVNAAVSYAQTGMADIVPFRVFWQHADQTALSRWISPYLMVLLEVGSRPEVGAVQPLGLDGISWSYWSQAFRLERIPVLCPHALLFLPLLTLSVAAAKLEGVGRRAATWPLVALGLATLGCGAVNQPVSLQRFAVYLLLVAVSISTLGWSFLVRIASRRGARVFPRVAFVALAFAGVAWASGQIPAQERATRWQFALGRLSYSEAYEQQGASWQGSRELASKLPPGARVWSLNALLGMAPTPRLESMGSFSMGPRWHEVLFEPPERARAVLREEGLDYFLIDTRQQIFDLLPHAPLFRPDQLDRWLGVAWHQEGTYLLTWKDRSATPVPEEFLGEYRAQIEASQQRADWKALYERLGSIYRANRDRPYPLKRESGLPAIRGWQ